MPLNADGQAILTRAEELGLLDAEWSTIDELRELTALERPLFGPPASVAEVRATQTPGPAAVPLRIYVPHGRPPFPTILFIHGGGWVVGSVEHADTDCRGLCADTGAIVVSVDYRLAPEHPFPAGLEDCLEAALWTGKGVAQFGGDPDHLAIAGDSAGGNLAAGLAVTAAADARITFGLQILIYPVTDCSFETASYLEFASGYLLKREDMRWFWERYGGDRAVADDPRASVLRADPAVFPPTIVLTAECDVLRDEAELFARRLRAAGVAARLCRFDGLVHGFWSYGAVTDAPRQVGRAIREALHGAGWYATSPPTL